MTITVNPKGFNIGDAAAAAEGITSFNVMVGTATGGPYSAASASVALSALTLAGGVYSGQWSQLTFTPALPNNTNLFAVVEAVGPGGTSGPSPEAEFSLATTPTAPTSFTLD